MLKYSMKRILLAIVTVFIIASITFCHECHPGGPFAKEKAPEPRVQAVLEARYGLDKPVSEQFVMYLTNLLHGDFGVSLKTGREISQTIFTSFSVSATLGAMAIVVALVFGLLLGSTAA